MKAFVFFKDKEHEYDVIINKNKNKYSIKISVDTNLPDNIEIIKTYDENGKKISMISCHMSSYSVRENGLTSITYESSYVIDNWIENMDVSLKELSIHFREVDYMWIKNRYRLDINKHILAKKKPKYHLLYKNEHFQISVQELYENSYNENGQTILNFPCKIFFEFEKEINIKSIFEYIRKAECCFGFMVGYKLNLLSIDIKDTNNEYYKVITPYIKEYSDCREIHSHILDLHGSLINNIVNNYFKDSYLQVCINNFYEYIYNTLDSILEFTSLCNNIEILSNHNEYQSKIVHYSNKISDNRKKSNLIFNKILKKINADEKKFLNGIYNLNYTSLRDKLLYFFYNDYNLVNNDSTKKFINKIVNTRNYYVHGGRKTKFDYDEIIVVSILLRAVLYLSILKICNKKIVKSDYVIVTSNKATINNCYAYFKLVEDFKNV